MPQFIFDTENVEQQQKFSSMCNLFFWIGGKPTYFVFCDLFMVYGIFTIFHKRAVSRMYSGLSLKLQSLKELHEVTILIFAIFGKISFFTM